MGMRLAVGVAMAALALGSAAQAEPVAAVALAQARKVALVAPDTGTVVQTWPVAVSPHGIAVSADGRLVFVPDLLKDVHLRVVEAATGREVRQVTLDAPAHHLTLAAGGQRLYATLTTAGRLAIVDLDTWTVRAVPVGGAPDVAVSALDGRTVYVSDVAGSQVVVVDADQAAVRARLPLEAGPGHGALALDGTRAFFTLPAKGAVAVLDLAHRQTRTVPTGADPHGIAVGHDGRRLFVSNRADGTVTVIDLVTLAVEQTIRVADGPEHLTPTPDGRAILVAVPSAKQIAVIDAGRLEVIRRIAVDGDPHQIAF